jgi:hypothetical protein
MARLNDQAQFQFTFHICRVTYSNSDVNQRTLSERDDAKSAAFVAALIWTRQSPRVRRCIKKKFVKNLRSFLQKILRVSALSSY